MSDAVFLLAILARQAMDPAGWVSIIVSGLTGYKVKSLWWPLGTGALVALAITPIINANRASLGLPPLGGRMLAIVFAHIVLAFVAYGLGRLLARLRSNDIPRSNAPKDDPSPSVRRFARLQNR